MASFAKDLAPEAVRDADPALVLACFAVVLACFAVVLACFAVARACDAASCARRAASMAVSIRSLCFLRWSAILSACRRCSNMDAKCSLANDCRRRFNHLPPSSTILAGRDASGTNGVAFLRDWRSYRSAMSTAAFQAVLPCSMATGNSSIASQNSGAIPDSSSYSAVSKWRSPAARLSFTVSMQSCTRPGASRRNFSLAATSLSHRYRAKTAIGPAIRPTKTVPPQISCTTAATTIPTTIVDKQPFTSLIPLLNHSVCQAQTGRRTSKSSAAARRKVAVRLPFAERLRCIQRLPRNPLFGEL